MAQGNPGIPLWRQLQAAATVLGAVRAGQSATQAIASVEATLRPAAQALAFQVLRQLGRAEHLRQQLARRAPPPAADALLCTALALAWDPAQAPYEPFTLVNQAVEAAKRSPATRAQAAFINACLRRFLRERDALVAAGANDPTAKWNHPRWWIDRLRADHPTQWEQVLAANNRHPPMTLRINRSKVAKVHVNRSLLAINLEAIDVADDGLELARPCPVTALPGFAEGFVSVQDAAAQCAAPLLLDGLVASGATLRVLDACAAPGGKTAHLLEVAAAAGQPIDVTALDIDAERCTRVHDTLARLGLQAKVIVADAAQPDSGWYAASGGQPFDAILLDAPCTASGIVRRHPDIRWLRRASDIGQLAAIQAELLKKLWPLVRPGGRLLYCTCSVFRAEGYEQIQTFVTHNTDALMLSSPGHLMPQSGANGEAVRDNRLGDHDGFFYALLEKRPA